VVVRQLEHVVGAAGFRRADGEVLPCVTNREEVLTIAVAAEDEGAVANDVLPEELGAGPVVAAARELVLAGDADDARDVLVGMQPVEDVLVPHERSELRSL